MARQVSELQDGECPPCLVGFDGQHCVCLDVQDQCCDCEVHVGPDGNPCSKAHSPPGIVGYEEDRG